jgi:hypothetical protein
MNRTTRSILTAAALAGLYSGSFAVRVHAAATRPGQTIIGDDASKDAGKHACKGQNSCKGQGGCNSSDNGCKGKNSCKGKGGCSTSG